MSLTVEPVSSQEAWDAFLEAVKPHTFLQSWAWGSFQARSGHDVFRLGCFDSGRLVGCALALLVRARRGSIVLCPHGPLIETQADEEPVLRALTDSLCRLARDHGAACVRVCPLHPDNEQSANLFARLGFRPAPIHMHPERAWLLDITPSDEEVLRGMRKTTRSAIRKAEAEGVEVRMSRDADDVETFWNVYRTTVDRQHFTPFSKTYLREEFESFAAEGKVSWFFASYRRDVVSAAMILFDGHEAYYHQGASTHAHPNIPASQLLQWRVIQEAKRRGCATYNFWGIAPENRPRHPWAGLSVFKQGFGGRAESYLHAQDLVLRPRYWVTWAFETARRMRRGL